MKKMTKISTVVASLLIAGSASAITPGAYVGAGVGDSVLRTPSVNSVPGVATSQSRGGLGGRVFAGYNFTKNFGLEAALAAYASSTAKASMAGRSVSQKDSLNALSLIGKGYLPLGDTGLNAYVLGGLAEVRNQLRTTGNLVPASQTGTTSTNSLRPTYGLGMSYDLPNQMTTSLELSRIQGKGNMRTSDSAIPNADMISLNLGYNFG
ncbi:MAG TPA: outer membrane beta-barrel protein [Gammaproteobacteria bacterium]|nr:outer membrane beta-barrel protein [Gammaproteobacteria bacterium]